MKMDSKMNFKYGDKVVIIDPPEEFYLDVVSIVINKQEIINDVTGERRMQYELLLPYANVRVWKKEWEIKLVIKPKRWWTRK